MNQLPQATKDRINSISLPTFEEVRDMIQVTALAKLIFEQEPAGYAEGEEFKRQVKEVVIEARVDEALRAQPLLEALEKIRNVSLVYYNHIAEKEIDKDL